MFNFYTLLSSIACLARLRFLIIFIIFLLLIPSIESFHCGDSSQKALVQPSCPRLTPYSYTHVALKL